MASKSDAMQFDGTLKSAKEIKAWVGKDAKAVHGPVHATEDHHEAGLNLVEKDENGAPLYITVCKNDWLIRSDGKFAVFTDAQYQFMAGSK